MSAKADKPDTEPKANPSEKQMRTLEEALSSRAKVTALPDVDPEAAKRDPNVPNALAAGKVEDKMYGVADPHRQLTTERVGPAVTEHLFSGPHKPRVTIVDGEPVLTGGTGQSA